MLWTRSLAGYRSKLTLRDGNPGTEPNFLLPPALQCYDCHDYHNAIDFENPSTPALSLFNTSHRPQDLLFGFRKEGIGSMTEFGPGPQSGKTTPGFYETNPPGSAASYGVNTSAPPNETGGHYFKQDPTSSSGDAFDNGDKLPCRDCHDPHQYDGTGTWQAFFRKQWPTTAVSSRLGSTVQGSSYMANAPTPTGASRSDVNSRKLCAACHGYSNTSPVNFSDINPAYRNAAIVALPTTVGEHLSASQEACITCHAHNSIAANCSGCHGFPPAPYPPNRDAAQSPAYAYPDPHPRHVGRADGQPAGSTPPYSFECKVCHATSVMGSRAQAGIHQDNAMSIAFDLSALGVANPPDNSLAIGQSGIWCSNVYCHSNGGSDNTMGGAGNYFRSIRWGFTAAPLRCNGCHGPGTADNVIETGMPNYASGAAGSATANSHNIHVVVNRFDCSVCHFDTAQGNYATGRSIKTSPLKHVNGIREVVFDGTTASGTYDNTPATKTCHVSCHGSDTPRWGGTLANGCFNCHAGSEQNWKPQAYGDGVPNPVDNTQYLQSGHGRTGSAYPVSGNPAAGKWNATNKTGCYTTDPEVGCHVSTVAHVTPPATDPYRLGATYADNTTGLCLTCHGPSGSAVKKDVQEHAKAITGGTKNWPNNYVWKCVDCHDPHGDGTDASRRINMVRQAINNPTGADNANVGSDSKGRPLRAPGWTNIAFTDNTGLGAGSYAQPGGAAWGICEGCHRQTYTYNQTTDNAAGHQTGRCTQCHDHKKGFKAGCNACHGDIGGAIRGDGAAFPPEGPTAARTGKTYTWAETVGVSASRGDHLRHAGAAFYNKDCAKCHVAGYGSDAQHNNNKQSATMTAISGFGTWSGGAQPGYQSVTDDSCSNIACHSPASAENPSNVYRSATPFTSGPYAYTRYWIDNVTWDCYTCHPYDGRTATSRPGGADNTMATGSHTAHVATYGMACTRCHPSGTYTIEHKSGFVDWDFSGSPDPYGDAESYSVPSGTRKPTDNTAGNGYYGTCSNLYCHSAVQTSPPGGQPTHSTPTWGTASTGNCGTCHAGDGVTDNTASLMATGSHTKHVNKSGYDIGCTVCHTGAGTGTTLHADGLIQVTMGNSLWRSFTLTGTSTIYDNTTGAPAVDDNLAVAGADASYGRCSAIPCHTDGKGGAPLVNPAVWGATDTTCTYCHDRQGSATTLSARHQKHTDNTAGTGYNFTCDECHALTVANDSRTTLNAATGYANHVDGTLTVSFSTTLRSTAIAIGGTYTQGTDNCANTYCHSDGTRIKTGSISANSVTWGTAGPLACNACHGNPPSYTSAANKANSHGAHVAFGCQTCHSQTTTTGNTITGADNHVNGVYNVSGTGFTYTFNAAGSTCAFTSGCHSGTVTWGGGPLANGCFACHTGSEVANKPLEAADGTANPVDMAQYNSVGHGNSTTFAWDGIAGPAFLYGNTGVPNNGCYECHSSGASHIPKSGTDPYRLGTWASNVDGLCNDCHGPSAANPRRASNALNLNILGHNKVNTGSARTWPGNYDYKCVDCHDPHGDNNYYLIRSAVNNPVNSTDTNAGSNVYGTPKDNSLSAITFTSLSGLGANSYAIPGAADGICEVCHNQTTLYNATGSDNAGTHASRTGRCTTCHTHESGFKGAGHAAGADCKGCHASAQGSRRAIQPEFNKTYQHGNTWANLTSSDCEKCHEELSQDGAVKLKIWGANQTYPSGTYSTVTYTSANADNVNQFCLSCHDADATKITFTGNATLPADISTRWMTAGTVGYNKYPPGGSATTKPNSVPVIQKAYSPHRLPASNRAKTAGEMTALPATWGGRTLSDTRPVACLDCHPAHGSNLASGVNATMGTGGKMLFDNNGTIATEEGLCWACHTKGMDYYGDDVTNNQSWRGNWLGFVPYKRGGFRSSHFYPSKTNTWTLSGTAPSGATGTTQTGVPPSPGNRTTVYCSTCHNPHGVATGDADYQYRVPILRGAWLTSPYKEDRAPGATANTTGVFTTEIANNFGGPLPRTVPSRQQADANPGRGYDNQTSALGHEGYFIDQNTFALGSYIDNGLTPTVTDSQFAGLCLVCHPKATLLGLTWKGHRSVAGWGASDTANMDLFQGRAGTRSGQGSQIVVTGSNSTEWMMQYYGGTGVAYGWGDSDRAWGSRNRDSGGTPRTPSIASRWAYQSFPWGQNATTAGTIQYGRQTSTTAPAYTQQGYHHFPCSKCHTPHASRLPRLMVTNCLDNGDGTGTPGSATGFTASPYRGNLNGNHFRTGTTLYTNAITNGNAQNPEAPNCHSTGTSYSSGWNSVTPW